MKIFDCNNECQYCLAYYCEERNGIKYETHVTNQIEKKIMRKMIESAIRLIDEVNSAVLMGNKDMLGYSHDALEQAISMLTSLESQLTNDEKRKLKIASTLLKNV